MTYPTIKVLEFPGTKPAVFSRRTCPKCERTFYANIKYVHSLCDSCQHSADMKRLIENSKETF